MYIVYWMEKCPVVGEYLEHRKFDESKQANGKYKYNAAI